MLYLVKGEFMKKCLIGICLAVPVIGFAAVATETVDTQVVCGDTTTIFNELRNKYKESPIVMGDVADKSSSIMSLWTSKVGESWTIVASKDDISCIIGAGSNLKIIRKGKTV